MPDAIPIAEAFAAAAVLGLAVSLLFTRVSRAPVAAAGMVVALLAAVYGGVWILGLPPHFPPREDLDRLLLIVLPAAAVAEIVAARWGRAGWVARGVMAVLAAPVLLYGSVYVTDLSGPGSRTWSPGETALVFAALAVLLAAEWAVLHRLAVRRGGRTALACVAGAVLGAGPVIMLSGYATGGQVGVPFGAGLTGVLLACLLRKGKPGGEAALGVGVVGLFALLVVGQLFAELTTLNAALLFAAPLVGWLPELLPARPRARVPLRLALAAAPILVALALAHQKFAADSADTEPGAEGSIDGPNFGR